MLTVAGAIYGIRSLWLVAGVLLVADLVSRYLPVRALAAMDVRVDHPYRLFHGESALLSIEVTNHGRLPVLYAAVTHTVPFDLAPRSLRWVTSLQPREARGTTFDLAGTRRGIFHLGPTVLGGGDLLGWHPTQRSIGARQRVVVYPRIVLLHHLGLPARAPFPDLRTRRPLHEDPYRLAGVRDYRPGDSTRKIHWPATARIGSMQVRKHQHGWSRVTMVLLDLSREGMGGTRTAPVEVAVTAAASVLYQIVAREKLAAGLRTIDITIDPSAGQAHLMTMLEVLAGAGLHSGRGQLTESIGLPFGATLLLVTGTLDGTWQGTLHHWLRRGWRPSVLFVGEGAPVAIPGVPIRSIRADRDLAEALQ